jgi:toxin ParE1/3/4
MVKVNLSIRALADLDEITEYAEKQSHVYAANITKRIFDRIAQLADFPLIGRIVPEFENETLRELISGNYRIVYKVY